MKFIIILTILVISNLSFADSDSIGYGNTIGDDGDEIVYANAADEAACTAMDNLIDATKAQNDYRKKVAYSHVIDLNYKDQLSSMWILRAKEFAETEDQKGRSKLFEDHMSQACQTFLPSDVDAVMKEMERFKKSVKGK